VPPLLLDLRALQVVCSSVSSSLPLLPDDTNANRKLESRINNADPMLRQSDPGDLADLKLVAALKFDANWQKYI